MDGLDIDNEYTGPSTRDFYEELGGDLLPVSVYKYSKELLEDLRSQVLRDFPEGLDVVIHSMETSEWLEGWKESFKPIETEKFYIYPPWDSQNIPKNKIPLVVEPGMAFGTGQHATTQVVLRRLEALAKNGAPFKDWRLMDVGTGTGILALGAMKLGFKSVLDMSYSFPKPYNNLELAYYGSINGFKKGWVITKLFGFSNGIKYVHELENLYFALTGEELTY
jgi:ribosomal protein L11 methyltransferase